MSYRTAGYRLGDSKRVGIRYKLAFPDQQSFSRIRKKDYFLVYFLFICVFIR